MKKRGQTNVLVTILVILIAIVLVVIVFNVVRPLVSEKSQEVNSGFDSYLKMLFRGQDENTTGGERLAMASGSGNIINISSCQILNQSNKVYILNQSIINNTLTVSCMNITAQNVTLDCQGRYVKSSNYVSGIYSNQQNTTIKNCAISFGNNAVYFDYNSTYSAIINNNLTGNGGDGITVVHSFNRDNPTHYDNIENHVTISYNIISNNSGSGINLRQRGDYWSCDPGDSAVTVTNNNITNNGGNGLNIYGSNNSIDGNTITGNQYNGIYSFGGSNVLEYNNIRFNGPGGYGGIFISGGMASGEYTCNGQSKLGFGDNVLIANQVCNNSGGWWDIQVVGGGRISNLTRDNQCGSTNQINCLSCLSPPMVGGSNQKTISNVTIQLFLLKNITVCNIPGMGCLNLKLNSTQINSIKSEVNTMISNVSSWTNSSISLHLQTIEIPTGIINMSFYSGESGPQYWVAPGDVRSLIKDYVTKDTDFVFVTNPTYDDAQKKQIPIDDCGLTFGTSTYTIGGAGYTWIPSTKSPLVWFECASSKAYIHEWLHQLDSALENVVSYPDIYSPVYDSSPFPKSLCQNANTNIYLWFPNPDYASQDPDFSACVNYYGNWTAYCDFIRPDDCDFKWDQHVLMHYNQSISLVGNYCRNSVRDFDEKGVDCGGTCSDCLPGLISYWKLNESAGSSIAVDSISGNNGVVNGSDFVSDSIRGKVIKFNGTGEVGVPRTIYLNQEVTVSAWVKPSNLSTYMDIVGKYNNLRLLWEKYDGFELVIWGNTSGYTKVAYTGTSGYAPNQWYHVVGVYNGSSGLRKIYINGVNATKFGTPLAEGIEQDFWAVFIGNFFDGSGTNFNGSMDDVMIYSKALNDSEVRTLYCSQGGSC